MRSRSAETGGDAGELAVAPIGCGRHVDGARGGIGEADETLLVASELGELVELLFGFLDLGFRRQLDRRVIGRVHDVRADADQRAALVELVDDPPILLGVDDGRRLGREPREILRYGHPAEIGIAEIGLQRDRRGELAGPDERGSILIDAAMYLLGEMRRIEKIGDLVERLVVDQDGAEQRLLRLGGGRRLAIFRRLRRDGLEGNGVRHGGSAQGLESGFDRYPMS